MKKNLFLFVITIILACSCVLDNSTSDVLDNSTCYVSFDAEHSRSLSASMTYPPYLDGTWTMTARKTDGGSSTGAGTYTDVILTDTFGPFSPGSWEFTLSSERYTGTVETTLHVGSNQIAIRLHTTASEGTLSFEDSNFTMSEKGAVTKVLLIVDGEDAKSWTYMQMTTEDGDLYMIPKFTKTLSKGIHTFHLRYVFESGDVENEPDVSFRIDGGATTHITVGMTDGSLTFQIAVDTVEPLVEG